jgi:DNA-binding MarR family transcriptional regulator
VPPAWVRLLRAHATLRRSMDANLLTEHQLTINDYEVLLALAHAEDRRLRRVDLAERVLLTQSGITRLLQGLERSGLVERGSCATDGRVVYALLTDAGYERLREASRTHLDDIRSLFAARFTQEELDTLEHLLGRVLEGDDEAPDCGVD